MKKIYEFLEKLFPIEIKITIILFVILMLLTSCQSYYATLGGASYHFKREYKNQAYNEMHNNIGGGGENTFGKHNFGTTTQFVKNSFNNDSVYAAGHYTYTNYQSKNFTNKTGVLAGFATGYSNRFGRKGNDIVPVAGFMNDACFGNHCLYQVILPPFDGMSGVIVGGYKFKF
jgi:hypothetical protein